MTAARPGSWSDRANRHFPQGSNGEYDFPDGLAPVFQRANGCRVWDTDGREYVDYTMAWGSALVGHAAPQLVEAVTRQLSSGINLAALSTQLVELAERLNDLEPWLDKVRFVSTGTEATMTAIRIARGATGRSRILKFIGAFHGSSVEGVANFFWSDPARTPAAEATGTGGAHAVDDLLVAPYNDLATAEELIRAHRHELAGVIIDPVQRSVFADPSFLHGLRRVTANAASRSSSTRSSRASGSRLVARHSTTASGRISWPMERRLAAASRSRWSAAGRNSWTRSARTAITPRGTCGRRRRRADRR